MCTVHVYEARAPRYIGTAAAASWFAICRHLHCQPDSVRSASQPKTKPGLEWGKYVSWDPRGRQRKAGSTPDEVAVLGLVSISCALEQVVQKLDHILEGVSEDAAHVAQHIHPRPSVHLLQRDQLKPAEVPRGLELPVALLCMERHACDSGMRARLRVDD